MKESTTSVEISKWDVSELEKNPKPLEILYRPN